jgi:hypothetical protein
MKKTRVSTLLIALVLLLHAYVGSYLALVVPGGMPFANGFEIVTDDDDQRFDRFAYPMHYRCCESQAATLFWPLEQIDRRLRPDTWVNLRRIRRTRT